MKVNARAKLDTGSPRKKTGDEGFVSLYIDDEFWVLNAKGGYSRRKVFHRKFKQGKGKGRGGKQSKRPGFRPRSKKGKGYMTEEFQDDQAYFGKKGKKGGKKSGKKSKDKDSFKSQKKGKHKADTTASSSKANLAEEHSDAQEATSTAGDTWSDDYYWDSTYGCWVYFEQWDNQHESWNYFAHDGWDVRSDHRCREMATNF